MSKVKVDGYIGEGTSGVLMDAVPPPEYSDWSCEVMPKYFLVPRKGCEPNWFWRLTQYLAFGFKWTKKDD